MRKLTLTEQETVTKLRARTGSTSRKINPDKLRIKYIIQGNNTIAVLTNDTGKVLNAATAKFNPNDTSYNPETGQNIALSRAVRSL